MTWLHIDDTAHLTITLDIHQLVRDNKQSIRCLMSRILLTGGPSPAVGKRRQ